MERKLKSNNGSLPYSVRKRVMILYVIFLLALTVIIGRLLYLQIIIGDELKAKAIVNQTKDTVINPKRGIIYDREKRSLALSATNFALYTYPNTLKRGIRKKDFKSKIEDVSQRLSSILGLDSNDIYKTLKKNSEFDIIAHKIENDKADQIKNLFRTKAYSPIIGGFKLIEEPKRYYPNKNLASHTIGFTGGNGEGLNGLEEVYNSYLRGTPGRLIYEGDTDGNLIPTATNNYKKPKPGYDIILSIDEIIQGYAETALQNAIKNTKSKRGCIIAMDPQTGEILAITNKPDYNLNQPFKPDNSSDLKIFNKLDNDQKYNYLQKMWRSFAISDTYDPGSPFKMITAAAALEEGTETTNSQFLCKGVTSVNRTLIHDANGVAHGPQTFVQGLENSCNHVFIETGLNLGMKRLTDYTKAFGFNRQTGIDLYGEASGILFSPNDTNKVDLATMSFGQGQKVTPIAMLNAVCAIANKGKLLRPHLLKQVIDSKGKVIKDVKPEVIRQVVSEKTAETVSYMMEKVVSEGSGKNAQIPGYKIAGKTGTSEKLQNGETGDYVASFIGFAPYENPRIAMLVLLDRPKSSIHFGGEISAPVFKEVLEKSLNYLGIVKNFEPQNGASEKLQVSDYRGRKLADVTKELKDKNIKYDIISGSGDTIIDQIPLPGAKVAKNSIIKLMLSEKQKNVEAEGN